MGPSGKNGPVERRPIKFMQFSLKSAYNECKSFVAYFLVLEKQPKIAWNALFPDKTQKS